MLGLLRMENLLDGALVGVEGGEADLALGGEMPLVRLDVLRGGLVHGLVEEPPEQPQHPDVGLLGPGAASTGIEGLGEDGVGDGGHRVAQAGDAVREDELLAQVGLPTGTRTLHFLDLVARIDGSVRPETAESRLPTLARSIALPVTELLKTKCAKSFA